jgi:hypothetical protein
MSEVAAGRRSGQPIRGSWELLRGTPRLRTSLSDTLKREAMAARCAYCPIVYPMHPKPAVDDIDDFASKLNGLLKDVAPQIAVERGWDGSMRGQRLSIAR